MLSCVIHVHVNRIISVVIIPTLFGVCHFLRQLIQAAGEDPGLEVQSVKAAICYAGGTRAQFTPLYAALHIRQFSGPSSRHSLCASDLMIVHRCTSSCCSALLLSCAAWFPAAVLGVCVSVRAHELVYSAATYSI